MEPDSNNKPVYRTVTPNDNMNKEVTDSMIEPHTTGKKAFFKQAAGKDEASGEANESQIEPIKKAKPIFS